MAQPSNRTIPEVIRGMTIEQVCRLTRIAATPRILPLPLRAWAAKRAEAGGGDAAKSSSAADTGIPPPAHSPKGRGAFCESPLLIPSFTDVHHAPAARA